MYRLTTEKVDFGWLEMHLKYWLDETIQDKGCLNSASQTILFLLMQMSFLIVLFSVGQVGLLEKYP